MALKVNSDIALTGSLTVSGSYGLAAADIPSLAADKITSGTFAAARIPSLAASKITTGTFADARIASAANWNTAYNWGNHAAAGYSTFDGAYDSLTGRPTIPTDNSQLTNGAGYVTSNTNYYLNGISKSGNTLTFSVSGAANQTYTFGSLAFSSATYDNYSSWNLKTGGVQRTTVGSGGDLDIVGGENVTVGYSAGGVVTISSTDTNTQLSDAQVRSKISGSGLISYNSSTGVISTTANNYSLPAGSSTVRGGFKIGYTENGKNYPVEVSSEQMYVNVPWTDNNTTYSTATSSTLGLVKIGYTENGKNYPVELSSGQMYVNVPWTDTNTTYSVGDGGLTQVNFTTARSTKLDGIAEGANAYSLPAGSSTTRGGFKIGYTESGKNYPVEVSNEQMYVNVPWTDTNTTYSNATTSTSGLMSSTDKSKLNGIASGATVYSGWNLTDGAGTSNRVDSLEYVKFSGADITGSGSSSDPFVVVTPDNNTTYSAGTGLDLNGTTFSVESDLRDVAYIGKDSNNYIYFDSVNSRMDFYAGGVFVARLESDGDLHIKGDVIAFSSIFA